MYLKKFFKSIKIYMKATSMVHKMFQYSKHLSAHFKLAHKSNLVSLLLDAQEFLQSVAFASRFWFQDV